MRGAHLLVLAISALILAAVLAPIGHATESGEREAAKNARMAEKAARHAARLAEEETLNQQREAERAARRQAHRLAHEAEAAVHKEKEGNVVRLACPNEADPGVTIEYNNFPDAPRNSTVVLLTVHTESVKSVLTPIVYEFDGSSGVQTIPVIFPIGHSQIDVQAKWNTNGHRGGFDIHGPVNCGADPAFKVEKLQTLEGGTYTTSPIVGEVGQTVHYEVIATNTGNTLLSFGLTDSRCDEGTISSTADGASEPGQQVTFFCTHKLTQADEEASPLINVATVTGSPEEGEGTAGSHESNPVEATVDPQGTKEKEKEKEQGTGGEKTTAKDEVLSSTTTSSPGSSTPAGSSGVLAFASTTVPALHGPQGCVRSAFTAYVRSAGVQSVTFYLDGHKLRTLTYKSARKGLLSLKIDGSKLKVGVHRLMAKVTMKQASPSAKAAKANRSLMIVRCKSATVTPRFTG